MLRKPFSLLISLILFSSISISQEWNEIMKLSDNTPQLDHQFGYSVDIQGNTAVIGANGDKSTSVHVFEKQNDGTWTYAQELKSSQAQVLDQFGVSVSIDKDVIVVGAAWTDITKNGQKYKDAGRVYIFEKKGSKWEEAQAITASDAFAEDQFGISVDVSGKTIIVGAIWNDYDEKGKKARQDAGAAYIFEKSGNSWVQKQKLIAEDRKPFNLFGVSVSIDKNKALVGSYRSGFDAKNKDYIEFAGAAYLFEKNTDGEWEEKQKLTPELRTVGSFFGYSVSLKNDIALIGAQEHALDVHGGSELKGSGPAYIFKNTSGEWKQAQKITALDRQAHAYFGESVYTDGKKCIVGAWGQKLNSKGLNAKDTAGAAYIFEDSGNGKWVEKEKIVPSERKAGDQFGISVAIAGDYAVAGAWGFDYELEEAKISWAGAAFIFGKCTKPTLDVSASNEFVKYGDQVVLSASGADFIQWENDIKNNISFQPQKTQEYSVIGRNSDGCYSKAKLKVFVRQGELEALHSRKIQNENVGRDISDFKIIHLDKNRSLAASTEEIIQKFQGLTIISNLKFSDTDEPVANINVLLMDENGVLLKRGVTNRNGEVKFEMLDPDMTYDVVLDKNDPQLEAFVMKDGQEIGLKKKEFVEQVSGFKLLSHIEFTESSAPASDIYVLLLDENGYVLKKGRTNKEGIAHFEELDKSKNYQVIIDKNHPSLNVDVSLNGRLITINTKRILENFERLTILSRMAYTQSSEPASEIPVMLVDENGLVLKRGKTNDEGVAMFMIPDNKKTYRIVLDESMLESKMVANSDENRFDNIYFDFNSSKLRKEAFPILDSMAEAMKKDKSRKIVIHAHTDGLGSVESNIEVAEKRGLVVKQYLIKKGINSTRIEIDPVGASQPIASNDKDLGRQLNRRVEFEILY